MARILVVDDEPELRSILREALEIAGHEVTVAADGFSAIRAQRQQPADLIITDIFMPGKEGIETIMEIRKDFPNVKIIVMSGGGRYKHFEYLQAAEQLGATRSISKPFDLPAILRMVDETLAS